MTNSNLIWLKIHPFNMKIGPEKKSLNLSGLELGF